MVMVSLIGQFQIYLSDLLNEHCDNLPAAWANSMPLFQKRYVIVQAYRRLENMFAEIPETELVNSDAIDKARSRLLEVLKWLEQPSDLARTAQREDLKGFLKDNGSKALDKAISQHREDTLIFSNWLNKNHKSYRSALAILDRAISIRNDAAHGKIGGRITLPEARKYIVLVYRLIQKADEYLEHQPTP